MQVRPLQRATPLLSIHKALGARIITFAGWQMPIEYEGILKEALAVRTSCGLFDVSHMGEIELTGRGSLNYLQWVTTNDVARLKDGGCQYTLVCNESGGIIDDVILYRHSAERFMLCVNASNRDKVFGWLKHHSPSGVDVADVSERFALIALQGPCSGEVLSGICGFEPAAIRRFSFVHTTLCGSIDALVSRTGYTGEEGFELYVCP